MFARGAWSCPGFGALPDGTPLTSVDAETHDIYALEWEAP
jgi:hypothetical protein